jgi:glycosyltransferase involved in cell wall biosynthesis
MSAKHVLVLNQFAMPRTEWGLTRNAELFGRVSGWETTIVSANRDHYSQDTFTTSDPLFRLVTVPPYRGAGLARMGGWAIFATKSVLIGLTQRHLDLVYASTPHLLAPVAGWLLSRIRHVPLIVEVRDLWPESIVASGHLRMGSRLHGTLVSLEKFLYHQAKQVVVVTHGWESHFAALSVDPTKVHVLPNGAEPSDFAISSPRSELRQRHSVSGFTAIYAGAHGQANGLDQILDAAMQLPDVNFLLVGAGADKNRLVARAHDEQISNVEFRNPVPKTQLGDLLGACDVGLHVLAPWDLLAQGLSPNKLFDYMAAGLPVVSNCAHGLRDVVLDGECGRLGASNGLASCVADVQAASPGQRDEWSRRGKQLVDERFSLTAASMRLTQLLNSTVQGRTLNS